MSSTNSSSLRFTLGPGDVLRISVPRIAELTNRTERVSEDDTITLPMLGVINVNGMTEQDLRQALSSRLERYMYNPQVEIDLQTPENRVVSVLGAVKAPGRYLVASRSDTVMTLLSRAGGTTESAGSQILLFPVPPATDTASAAALQATTVTDPSTASALHHVDDRKPAGLADQAARPPSSQSAGPKEDGQESPLVISSTTDARYLDLPVRSGDVLFVPAAGSVAVQGWVDKPGSFPITNGMTVLSSVAAAGGALFSSSATLVREEQGGGSREVSLNLSKLKSGEQADPPVRGGDVIIVERSVAGAVPYSLYFLINKLGVGLPIVPY